jgi:RNA polymerase sigma factor (sigma-70 family)
VEHKNRSRSLSTECVGMSIIALTNSMTRSVGRHDPDAELIQHVAESDEKAFEQLVQKYQHAVFNTIYRYIGNYEDVEDVAQEIFLKVWHKAKSFKKKYTFSTWLYRITVNQCLNYRSRHKRKLVSLDEMTQNRKIPDSLIVEVDHEQRNKAEIVRRSLNTLPDRQRIALILSQFEEKTYKEIAEIMNTSISSVESLIYRAKQGLKKKLLPLRRKGKI